MPRKKQPRFYAGLLIMPQYSTRYACFEKVMEQFQPLSKIHPVMDGYVMKKEMPYELLRVEVLHNSPRQYFRDFHIYDCQFVSETEKSYQLLVNLGYDARLHTQLVKSLWVRKSSMFYLISVKDKGGK